MTTPVVAFVNNYSMDKALNDFVNGTTPGQHLYGRPQPEDTRAGLKWITLPSIYDKWHVTTRLGELLRNASVKLFGDVVAQSHAWKRRNQIQVIFAADQWSARLLLLLRRAKMITVPIVILVHHPPRGLYQAMSLRAADRLCYLSPSVEGKTRSILRTGGTVLHWGPLADSPVYRVPRQSPPSIDFVAAGKTNRDYTGLREVALQAGLNGVIHDGHAAIEYVDGVAHVRPGRSGYREIVRDIVRARCICIPLRDPAVMSGLTEICDAIALDRPVIITSSEMLPYPIRESGAGVVIDSNSGPDILAAVLQLTQEPGASAMVLHETFNYERYTQELDSVLTSAIQADPASPCG